MNERPKLHEIPQEGPSILENVTCLYCGGIFGASLQPTKEHVVGRRFVPVGALDRQWNLIARACGRCNNVKADLEDDLSAISMQPNVVGEFASDDPRLNSDGRRKGDKSISRRTGKVVAASREELSIEGMLAPGVSVKFNMISPPQLAEDRAFRLAKFHVSAFFYWITFDHDTRKGGFFPGCFARLMCVPKSDWGNDLMRSFAALLPEWRLRFQWIGANGFFKALVRKHPTSEDLWAWALEWNGNYRLTGFFGSEKGAREVAMSLSWPESQVIDDGPNSRLLTRIEKPLSEDDDRLFEFPEQSP